MLGRGYRGAGSVIDDLAGVELRLFAVAEFDWGGFLGCRGEGVLGRMTSVIEVASLSFLSIVPRETEPEGNAGS